MRYNLFMTYFSQSDPTYKNVLLGYNTASDGTIGRFGCVITAFANMFLDILSSSTYSPTFVNDFLKTNNGFVPGGGILYWSAILKFGVVDAHGTTTDMNVANDWVKDGPNYAVLQTADGTHYVLLNKQGQIVDSADGKVKKWSAYKYKDAHLFRAAAGKGQGQSATPVAPAPPVTNGDPVMTDAQEQEAYLTILNRPREGAYSGRTGYQFIHDAKNEVANYRQDVDRTLAALQLQLGSAVARAVDAEGKLAAVELLTQQLPTTPVIEPVPVSEPSPIVPVATYTPAPVKSVDAITATGRLHDVSAQGYGLFKKLSAWFKSLVLK